MRLLLDTTGMTFTVGSDFEPVDRLRDQAAQGRPGDRPAAGPGPADRLLRRRAGPARSEILTVKTPGPKPVPAGHPVRAHELVANPWANNGRNGVAYRAASIEPVSQAQAKAS